MLFETVYFVLARHDRRSTSRTALHSVSPRLLAVTAHSPFPSCPHGPFPIHPQKHVRNILYRTGLQNRNWVIEVHSKKVRYCSSQNLPATKAILIRKQNTLRKIPSLCQTLPCDDAKHRVSEIQRTSRRLYERENSMKPLQTRTLKRREPAAPFLEGFAQRKHRRFIFRKSSRNWTGILRQPPHSAYFIFEVKRRTVISRLLPSAFPALSWGRHFKTRERGNTAKGMPSGEREKFRKRSLLLSSSPRWSFHPCTFRCQPSLRDTFMSLEVEIKGEFLCPFCGNRRHAEVSSQQRPRLRWVAPPRE